MITFKEKNIFSFFLVKRGKVSFFGPGCFDQLEAGARTDIVDDDGYTRIDETGNMMRVATKWRDYDAFLDLLVERLLAAP